MASYCTARIQDPPLSADGLSNPNQSLHFSTPSGPRCSGSLPCCSLDRKTDRGLVSYYVSSYVCRTSKASLSYFKSFVRATATQRHIPNRSLNDAHGHAYVLLSGRMGDLMRSVLRGLYLNSEQML